ncbi:MAG: hypothetical protein R2695_12190 [Acidimicrobiales bacterium]
MRSVALGLPGLPVDTHVGRLAGLLGLTTETDPVKIELELNPMVPAADRGVFSLGSSSTVGGCASPGDRGARTACCTTSAPRVRV